jgi:hypothetical protein
MLTNRQFSMRIDNSLHLRWFCLIALGERVPHESTVRKLTRRLGGAVVEELTRCVIVKAQRETRFQARAARIDSTVVEADVRYPSDAALSLDGARTLAREARKLAALVGRTPGWCGIAAGRWAVACGRSRARSPGALGSAQGAGARAVNGHRFLPTDGHRNSALADMFSPRWWP